MYNIETYVSRYVIPFNYEKSNDGYSKIVSKFNEEPCNAIPNGHWGKEPFWNEKDNQGHVFSYLHDLLNSDIPDSSIGVTYSLKNDTKEGLYKFLYNTFLEKQIAENKNEKKQIDKTFNLSIDQLGVVIFKNGNGFLWFELRFNDELPTEDEYIEFQNYVKHISHKNDCFKTTDGKKMRIADVIKSIVPSDIHFWMSTSNNTPAIAYLFQYVFLSTDETVAQEHENRRTFAYRLANGYTKKYNPPLDLKDSLYEPFGNVSLYISKPGMACVVENSQTSDAFFTNGFDERFRNNYFFIYILLLYQEFSCINYSKMLSELPLKLNMDKSKNRKEALEKIDCDYFEINEFLVKCMFGTVSEMSHYNYFYRYGKKALFIDEEINSLMLGFEPLKSYLDKASDERKEKKDRRRDTILGVFVFFQMFSILVDALGVMDYFVDRSNWSTAHVVTSGVLIVSFIAVVVVLIIDWIISRNSDK